MGTGDLLPKNIPLEYSAPPLGDPSPTMPRPLLRFCFNEKHSHPSNHAGIRDICDFITSKGAGYEPAAAPYIRDISASDLEAKVAEKFKALQKSLRAAGRLTTTGDQTAAARGELGLNDPQAPPQGPKVPRLSKPALQSRQKGVSEM